MKANEFFKQHGLKKVKNICERYFDYTHVTDDARMLIIESDYKKFAPHFSDSLNAMVKIADLKRLVASHGIVQSKGGLKKAKEYLSKKHILSWSALDGQLSQAVKDMEACQ